MSHRSVNPEQHPAADAVAREAAEWIRRQLRWEQTLAALRVGTTPDESLEQAA